MSSDELANVEAIGLSSHACLNHWSPGMVVERHSSALEPDG